jgi:hypothetical protein
VLVLLFLAVIATVPIVDLVTGRARQTGVTPGSLAAVGPVIRQEGWIAGAYALLRQMHQLEDGLERKSWLGAALLPRTQRVLTAFGVGNEKVYLGRDRWLYYTPDVQYVTGFPFLERNVLERRRLGGQAWEDAPHPDPLPALVDFQRQLARRGIALLLVPTPLKPMIDPEPLAGATVAALPLENPSWSAFVRRLDAAGLALFAVSGTLKALDAGLNPVGAVLLGVLTGVGGGMLRDVLVSEVPAVLRGELYASAALAGAAVVVLGRLLRLPGQEIAILGGLLCFALRYQAIRRGWRLPVAEQPARRADDREAHR